MLPQCFNCKHFYTGDKCDAYPAERLYNCDAFPDPKRQIPEDLLSNTVLHKTPYAGDHGILYDPIDPNVSYQAITRESSSFPCPDYQFTK